MQHQHKIWPVPYFEEWGMRLLATGSNSVGEKFLFISNGNCPSPKDLPLWHDCVNFAGGTITLCNINITPNFGLYASFIWRHGWNEKLCLLHNYFQWDFVKSCCKAFKKYI